MKANLLDVIALSKKLCAKPINAKLKYATPRNFVGRVIDGYNTNVIDFALMSPIAASKLCEVQNYLIENYGYGLIIYDAYRPKRAVKDFLTWSKLPAANEFELERKNKHYPHIEKQELFSLGYLAEDSGHCYGNTVDVFLINLADGKILEMGSCYDYMDDKSCVDIDSRVIGDKAAKNRKILKEAMTQAGFESYIKEFWHYAYQGVAGREVKTPLDIEITSQLKGAEA